MKIANKIIKRVEEGLSIAIGGLRKVTSYLTPKDDWVEVMRRRYALAGDKLLRRFGRPLVRKVGSRDYAYTVNATGDKTEEIIMRKYQRNLASTRKFRMVGGSRDWADGSFVYDPDDTDWQHHVYIFENDNGITDVYAHKEKSAEHDPYGHVTEAAEPGDYKDMVKELLQIHGLRFHSSKYE